MFLDSTNYPIAYNVLLEIKYDDYFFPAFLTSFRFFFSFFQFCSDKTGRNRFLPLFTGCPGRPNPDSSHHIAPPLTRMHNLCVLFCLSSTNSQKLHWNFLPCRHSFRDGIEYGLCQVQEKFLSLTICGRDILPVELQMYILIISGSNWLS